MHTDNSQITSTEFVKRKPLGRLVGVFKTVSTKAINQMLRTDGRPMVGAVREPPLLWQRNYYEHIVRDERDLNKIRKYIVHNPLKWEYDIENINGISVDDKKMFWRRFLDSD